MYLSTSHSRNPVLRTGWILRALALCLLTGNLLAQQTELSIQTGHVAAIQKIVFSPDGHFLASSDEQHKICIWDMRTLTQMTSFYYDGLEEDELISLLAFNPSNNVLLAGTDKGSFLAWNIGTSQQMKRFTSKNVSGSFQFSFSTISNNEVRSSFGTNLVAHDMMFTSNSEALILSDDLYSVILEDTDIRKVSDQAIADLIPSGVKGEYFFCNFSGETGTFTTGQEPELRVTGSPGDDLQKTMMRRYVIINRMKLGKESLLTANTMSLNFYSLPSGEKSFSASTPYMDERITDLKFLPQMNYFLVSNTDGKVYVFDYDSKKLITALKDHISEVNSLAVHPTRNIFASGSADRSIIIWDGNNLKPLTRFYARASAIESLSFYEPEQLLVFGNELGYTKILDLSDRNPGLLAVKNHRQKVTDIAFLDEGKKLATASNDNHVSLLNTEDLTIEASQKFKSYLKPKLLLSNIIELLNLYVDPHTFIDSLALSTDKQHIIAIGYVPDTKSEKVPVIKNGEPTGKRRRQIVFYNKPLRFAFTSDDLKKQKVRGEPEVLPRMQCRIDSLILGVDVYNAENGHISTVTGAIEDRTHNRLITSSRDATIKLWDLETRKLLMTIIPIDKDKRIFITADNYYFAPKNALDAIGFKQGINFYPLEQFDLKYNRPDIVLAQLGNIDSMLISVYRKAYEKRLSKSGFSQEMFTDEWHAPRIEISNLKDLSYNTNKASVNLQINGQDEKYHLDRLNVWVNDIPVYGTQGIPVREEASGFIEKNLEIQLTQGVNKIQVSCMNEKGTESLKESVDVVYNNPIESKPDLYLIAMSVSEYSDNRYNLEYAAKDGKDITNLFNSPTLKHSNFNTVTIDTLFNRNAVRENFFALKEKLLKSDPNDQVVVFVSGHGLLNKDLDFYFATYDMDFSDPERRGISFDELENLLDSIPARKKLMMMDACHSGEVDKDEPYELVAQNVEVSSEITFRGSLKEYDFTGQGTAVAMSDASLNSSFELMQELFAGLDKGTGTMVISAAAGKGYALESPQWNNGVFTFSILNGLKNGAADKNKDKQITISELKEYSIRQVELLTGGQQKPTSRRESINFDWRVW
jgi:WD40 repeat protein